MLRTAKLAVLGAARHLGLFDAASRSARLQREKLLILCYHGVALRDEDKWNPGLYTDSGTLKRRFKAIRDSGCTVLPLGEALTLLRKNRLPRRSVAITFDDGAFDFYSLAFPIVRDFGFPVTLYLSTFYCQYPRPVFDTACSYMLWKSIGKTFDATGLLPEGGAVTIKNDTERLKLYRRIYRHIRSTCPSAEEKDELLHELAVRLRFDEEDFRSSRLLQYMNGNEVAAVAKGGLDIQLHTHRHRTPRDRELFLRELRDNSDAIQELTGSKIAPKHFCYPSGDVDSRFYPWLAEFGILSATTCIVGTAKRNDHPFELPRVLDMPTMTDLEFEGWLSGFSAMFPRRRWKQPELMS